MSEYWKSVPRKFCDFCKCWITDNKPSVEFHERGKRHKENVELKLTEVRKKSLQNSKNDAQMKADMDKMEKAALEAFKKDLQENPGLAEKYGVSLEPKPEKKTEAEEKSSMPATSSQADAAEKDGSVKEWYEAETPEGYHYYWSTVTGESRWDQPDEFVSLQEQEASSQCKDDPDSDAAKKDSSQLDISVPSEDPEPDSTTRTDSSTRHSAYGAWDIVKEVKQQVIYDEDSAPPALDDIPLPTHVKDEGNNLKNRAPKFKEKTVGSLSSSSEVVSIAFKKRKIAPGARNIRQKDSND